MIKNITASELKTRINEPKKLVLLDVREAWERDSGHLSDDIHIPLDQLPQTKLNFSPDDEIVVYCRAGGRSATAAQILEDKGFRKVHNLQGGMLAWATNH